jgi:uncharacterized membrane protein
MSTNKSNTAQYSISNQDADKKATVVRTSEEKKPLTLFIIPICIVIGILAGIYFYLGTGSQSAVQASADQVVHPVELFADGKARHFQFEADGGVTIKYFVIKSTDGVIRAAFDACDVCWPAGKGYYQSGDYMVCRNCGRKFASIKVNEVKGGCNPAPLKRAVVKDQLVIKTTDILTGRRYFDFSKRS